MPKEKSDLDGLFQLLDKGIDTFKEKAELLGFADKEKGSVDERLCTFCDAELPMLDDPALTFTCFCGKTTRSCRRCAMTKKLPSRIVSHMTTCSKFPTEES